MMRQITFKKFECGIQEMVKAADGRYDLVTKPVCTVEASAMAKSDIRKAIVDAGVPCPRGTEVYCTPVGKVQYKFTTEDLLAIAKERAELPLD